MNRRLETYFSILYDVPREFLADQFQCDHSLIQNVYESTLKNLIYNASFTGKMCVRFNYNEIDRKHVINQSFSVQSF